MMDFVFPRLKKPLHGIFLLFILTALFLWSMTFLTYRASWLDHSMLLITNVWYYLFIGIFLLFILFEKNTFTFQDRCIALIALTSSVLLAEILKPLIADPRPAMTSLTLAQESSYAFPSTHAASMYALLPLLFTKKHVSIITFFVIALIVAYSRMYVGVHDIYDVLAGSFLGLSIGSLSLTLRTHLSFPRLMTYLVEKDKEIRRQIAHLGFGVILCFLIGQHVITAETLLVALTIGTLFILAIKKWHYVPIIYPILQFFERDHHIKTFPGRGIFYFILGSFIALALFPLPIAQASVLILAFGDSITNVAGKYLGKVYLPYNHKKTIEGPLIASIFASAAASLFVPLPHAIIATSIAMIIETLPLYFGELEIDDNLSIPISAALVLWLLQL